MDYVSSRLRISLQYVIAAILTFALFEGILAVAFVYPKSGLLPREVLQSIYLRELRNVIQLMPECSQYDEYVSYTLKPGSCRFRNLEFDTSYDINSAGFRDDELSLESPEVVVLGDSFAMGWGVEQEETFAQTIETSLGLRTLNAGISSFGTAREMRVLERVDMSAVKYLVVQYMENDLAENLSLLEAGDLKIYSPEDRANVIETLVPKAEYFLGKYSLTVAFYSWHYFKGDKMFGPGEPQTQPNDSSSSRELEVDSFLYALQSANVDTSELSIILFEVGPYNMNDSNFVDALRERLNGSQAEPVRMKEMIVLDASSFLNESHYFYLDEHINALGHKAIADRLIGVINR